MCLIYGLTCILGISQKGIQSQQDNQSKGITSLQGNCTLVQQILNAACGSFKTFFRSESVPRQEEGSTEKYQDEVEGPPKTECWYFPVLPDFSQGTDIIQFIKVMKLQPQPQPQLCTEQQPCPNLEQGNRLGFVLLMLNNNNNNSFSLGIIYSHSNSHSYDMAKSLIVAVAKAKLFPKLLAKLRTKLYLKTGLD